MEAPRYAHDPNYHREAPQYSQARRQQAHSQHGLPDQQQQQYAYSPSSHVQPQRRSQSAQGQGAHPDQGQPEMLGRVPGRGPNALVPLDSSSNPNGNGTSSAGGSILPVVQQQQTSIVEPPSHSMIQLGRRYALEVVQQPQRARMCGFGDKDRRPITPPPCVRIVITDATTGAEIDTNDIEHSHFVLNVDLWSADPIKEVNLVQHSSQSPAISSTIPTSYAQAQAAEGHPVYSNPLPTPTGSSSIVRDPQYPYHYSQSVSQGQYNPYPNQPQVNPYSQPQQQFQQGPPHRPYGHSQQQQGSYGQRQERQDYHGPQTQEPPNHHIYYHTGTSVHAVAANAPRPSDNLVYDPVIPQRNPASSPQQGMYTRNLIGSLAASAARLTDPNDKIGIWFVLQDLSIRTEGSFRLRFSFCNVGIPALTPNGNKANQISIVNTGSAPILAACFSEIFTVYSAKKFPGVVESTPLSKCFATQGIKIPIRKDGVGKSGHGRGDDFDED